MIRWDNYQIAGLSIPVYSLNTLVVGTGAAGLACACRLFREMEEAGVSQPADQIAVATRGIGLGTSYNCGSDKQTYYKLGTHPSQPDSAMDFAATLTAGGCAQEDLALIEGANSLRCFYHLADAGVPFPHDGLGSFVGYKTDHDPRRRGTSAGPWTSRFMVRKLLAELNRYDVPVVNHCHLLSLIVDDTDGVRSVAGALCVEMGRQTEEGRGLRLFRCRNVVAAGGGPGALYRVSVYPRNQMGPYAALFEAGARAVNLTESQFGMASIKPRWNLSGTYQQVVPRYFSTGANGGDEREFLNPWFPSMSKLGTDIFLKGYQWPFDHDKVAGHGSSLVDILVQNETINLGRRVFMDFRENPRATDGLEPFDLNKLEPEALEYLQKSGAMQGTPIERLEHMNQPSIDLYRQMGHDLHSKPLEVGLCSQHCNGGFAVDRWWESNVRHLFVIGELAGTHGVKRPGGSALNAGQVGALRAAQRIAHVYGDACVEMDRFLSAAEGTVGSVVSEIARISQPGADALDWENEKSVIQIRMSRFAGMVRSLELVESALGEAKAQWNRMCEQGLRQVAPGYLKALETREMALAGLAFLSAIRDLLARGGGSRGSYLVTDPGGTAPHPDLGEEWNYLPENVELRGEIPSVELAPGGNAFVSGIVKRRPCQAEDDWFENTWAQYRSGEVYARDEVDEV